MFGSPPTGATIGSKRGEPHANDGLIFPMTFAPVIVNQQGKRAVRPMRYPCRLAGKPPMYDRKFPGTYNAFGAFLTVSS
jgi:hypothetical protein